jgi:hypothetical protein
MAARTVAGEHLLAPRLGLVRVGRVEFAVGVQLRGRREVDAREQVVHRHRLAVGELPRALALGERDVAVEVGRVLLRPVELLQRADVPLRPEPRLREHPAQGGRVQPEPLVLRADVRGEVDLPRRVAVDVAVEARHALDRLCR